MCRLFETIKINDGVIRNLPLHEERMNRSRRDLFGKNNIVKLSDHILVPAALSIGVTKCRIIYGPDIISTEFFPYFRAEVNTLKMIETSSVIYNHKYLDRSRLNALIDKNIADDIIIIKNGFVTDCSYANIVFTDGEQWITPDTPLLHGVMRERLLQEGIIREERIKVKDLSLFSHFRLINAMLEFESPIQPMRNIF